MEDLVVLSVCGVFHSGLTEAVACPWGSDDKVAPEIQSD